MAIALSKEHLRLRDQLEEQVRKFNMPSHEARRIWESKMGHVGYDRGNDLEDAFKYAMQGEFGVAPRKVTPVRAAPAPNPNEIASLKMSLSQLKALWAAKWGEQWVIPMNMDVTEDVAFWWNAYQRLLQQGCFEVYTMGNVEWRRLKEENTLGNS